MARPSKQDYRYHDDGNVALYRRPNSAMWYARCKLEDGTALNPRWPGAPVGAFSGRMLSFKI